MLQFRLDTLVSKELFRNVLIKPIKGDELTLNFFELKNKSAVVPFHAHPVEHLIIVSEGEIEFIFEGHNLILKERDGLFLPANTFHSARVVRAPVRAFEIYVIAEDEYYKQQVH